MPDKLFNRSILTVGFITISKFLIKCVVSHIVHDIHDRTELVTQFVLVSIVIRMCDIFTTACDAAYLDIGLGLPLAEFSYSSAVYN